MHVVIASHHRLPVEGYGGPQRVVVALVRGLAAHGHRVSVIAQPGTRLTEASKVIEVAPSILKNTGGGPSAFIPHQARLPPASFSPAHWGKAAALGPPHYAHLEACPRPP